MKNATLSIEVCMDIFDWFDDPMLKEITDALETEKGEEYVQAAMEMISGRAAELVNDAKGTEDEYPGVLE